METECHVPSEDVDNACEAGAEGGAAEKTARGSTVAEGTAAPEDLERKLAEAEAKAQENWNMYLRALADLENYRRRTARDLAFHIRSGKKDLILKLLTVVDDMERALAAEADYEALHQGVEIIMRKLLDVLAAEGVAPIEAVGQLSIPGSTRLWLPVTIRKWIRTRLWRSSGEYLTKMKSSGLQWHVWRGFQELTAAPPWK